MEQQYLKKKKPKFLTNNFEKAPVMDYT